MKRARDAPEHLLVPNSKKPRIDQHYYFSATKWSYLSSYEIFVIFSYLRFSEIVNCAVSCKSTFNAFEQVDWKLMYATTFHVDMKKLVHPKENLSWKDLFRNRNFLHFLNFEMLERPLENATRYPFRLNPSSMAPIDTVYHDFWHQFNVYEMLRPIASARLIMNAYLDGRISNNGGYYHRQRPSFYLSNIDASSSSQSSCDADLNSESQLRQKQLFHDYTYFLANKSDMNRADYHLFEEQMTYWIFYHPETSAPIRFMFRYFYNGDNEGSGSMEVCIKYNIGNKLQDFPFYGNKVVWESGYEEGQPLEDITKQEEGWVTLLHIHDDITALDEKSKNSYQKLAAVMPSELKLMDYIKTVACGASDTTGNDFLEVLDLFEE